MSIEENKAIARRLFEDVFNGKNANLLLELVAEDFVDHTTMHGKPLTRDSWYEAAIGLQNAVPDGHNQIEDLIAEGDRVVIRTTFTGTQKEDFAGMKSNNNKITVYSIMILRIRNGKIVERWLLISQ